MIDAATIGITLALQDGVSEGIAAIRRDLSALDRAVDVSAVNLARLGTMANALQSGQLGRLTEVIGRPANSALPRTAQEPAAPPAVAPESLVESGSMPSSSPPSVTLVPTRTSTAPAPPNAAPAPAKFPAPLPPPAFATFAPVFEMAPLTAPALPPMPAATTSPAASRRNDAASAAGGAINLTNIDPPMPPMPGFAPLPGPRARVAPFGPPGESVARANRPSTLPIVIDPPPNTTTDTRPEPMQTGRIVMEGYELGRWMTDRLTRDATRPPASATGFDPRLSPAWPGAGSGL